MEDVRSKVVEDEVTEEVAEPKKEGFGAKLCSGLKKIAKPVAAIAVTIGVGAIGYALGSKSARKDELDESESEDTAYEPEYTEI